MAPSSAASFQSPSEQPVVVDGQRNDAARSGPHGLFALRAATARVSDRSGFRARCSTCGAAVSDWRQLVGLGASVAPCAGDAAGLLLTYPAACVLCGANQLFVNTCAADGPSTHT
jgi:hypothetical protein